MSEPDRACADAAHAERPRKEDVTGVCLCGGASLRMGRDKAWIQIGGEPLVARALRALDGVAARVVLASGAAPRYASLGRECALDPLHAAGPLAGLAAGFAAARTPWLAFASCDLPFADLRLWQALLERAAQAGLDLVRYESRAGLEPAVFVARAEVGEAVRQALAAGERRLVAIDAYALPAAGGRALARGVLRHAELAARWPELAERDPATNVNTPAELARAVGGAASRPLPLAMEVSA